MSDNKEEAKEASKEEEKKDDNNGGSKSGGGSGAKEKFRNIINTTKPIDKIVTNSEDEKAFYETVRRWKVIIKEIYVISQKRFDCFLNFTIGGDLRVDTFKIIEKNKSGKIVHGARGYSEYTELQEILDINTRVKFEKEIHMELRDSIISLSKQNLIIECWDYNSFKLNHFQGFALIDLMKIIRGSVYQSANILQKVPTGEGGFLNKPLCKVEFQIFFQEIWDFVLSFEDWSATNLNCAFNVESKELQPGIDFKLNQSKMIKSTVSQKASSNPTWSAFDRSIKFRGTLAELENQSLQINISQNDKTIINRNKISRLTDLKGITINGIIKDFLPQKAENHTKEDELPDSILIGKININTIPKYNQMSHETFINLDQIYVCIYFQKLTLNQIPHYCKLPISTFITVEFNGKAYESYRIPIQINDKKFNQYMYFLLGTPNPKKILEGSIEKRLEDIVSHLKTKNEISVKLWIEDTFKCLDYIGKFDINLTDIFEKGNLMERKYKNSDNSDIIYKTKVFTGEDSFESSYEVQGVRLKYDLWFYPETYAKNIELPKEGIKKRYKENIIIEKASDILKNIQDEFFELKRSLRQFYQDYQDRFFDFFEALGKEGPSLSFQDENKNFRIINSYLSKLTVKNQDCDEIFYTADIEQMIKKKSQIEKISLSLENEKAMAHYIKCLRFANASEFIVLSPEYFMQTKKGSKFEHAILLACLLMNLFSNKKEDTESDITITENFEDNNNYNQNSNSFNNSKNFTLPDSKNLENKPFLEKSHDNSANHLDKISGEKELELNLNNTNHNNSNIVTMNDKNETEKGMNKLDITSRSIDNLIKGKKTKNNNYSKSILNKIPLPSKKKIDAKNLKKSANKLEEIAFDNSDLVFVCFGTLKGDKNLKTKNLHMWVMTFSTNFKDITFWEPLNNKKYVLKDRIMHDEIMKQFFYGEFENKEEIDKAISKLRKAAKAIDVPKSIPKNKNEKKILPQLLNQEEDIDTSYIKHKAEDILSEIKFMEMHIDIQRGYRLSKSTDTSAQEEYIRVNNLKKKVKIGNEDDNEGKNENNSYTFEWKENYKKAEIYNEVLPFRTIDVVFNKKNIYINKQHPNPATIFYDIYDSSKWYMVLKTTLPEMEAENFKIWREDIPSFYSFKNFQPNYSDEDIDGFKKNILSTLSSTIRNMRSQSNSTTFFKTNREIRDMLDIYLIFLEMKEVGLSDKKDFAKKIKEWSKFFKEKLSHKTTIEMIPLFFNYVNDGLICNYVEDNLGHFIQKSRKDSYFVLSCKIFQYPNRVLSIRVVIANFYKSDNEVEKLNIVDDEKANLLNKNNPLEMEI